MPEPRFALPPQYNPHDVERRLYQRWLDRGVFTPRADSPHEPYVIVIPPPNVTAILHVGHGLNNVIQDVLIRFERMRGRAAEWLPGTDHAGIATQNVVERRSEEHTEEHTSELQSRLHLVCRLLLEKKKKNTY